MVSFTTMLRIILVGLGFVAFASVDRAPTWTKDSVAEPWVKTYADFRAEVTKLNEKIERNYYPEFMMIKGTDVVASVQIDAFGAKVMKEAEELFQPYREGLMACVSRHRSEYRAKKTYSFERFAWFLDSYVKILVSTIGEHEEPKVVGGVREKRVATDRALYAYTQLGLAYLREKMARQKAQGVDDSSAERRMETALSDIGRRVFRLDLTEKFDYRELVEKGPQTQPVFRSLANEENRADLDAGLEPLHALMTNSADEPTCPVSLAPRKP
jgi:hypothetical protein